MAGFFVALSFWQVPTRLSRACLSRDGAHRAASPVHGPSIMEPVCVRAALRLSPELPRGLQSSKEEAICGLCCFEESELASCRRREGHHTKEQGDDSWGQRLRLGHLQFHLRSVFKISHIHVSRAELHLRNGCQRLGLIYETVHCMCLVLARCSRTSA